MSAEKIDKSSFLSFFFGDLPLSMNIIIGEAVIRSYRIIVKDKIVL